MQGLNLTKLMSVVAAAAAAAAALPYSLVDIVTPVSIDNSVVINSSREDVSIQSIHPYARNWRFLVINNEAMHSDPLL